MVVITFVAALVISVGVHVRHLDLVSDGCVKGEGGEREGSDG